MVFTTDGSLEHDANVHREARGVWVFPNKWDRHDEKRFVLAFPETVGRGRG